MSTTTTRQTADERREAVLAAASARVRPQGAPRRLHGRDREGRRHLAAVPLPALRDEEGAVPRRPPRRRWRRPTRPSRAPRAARRGEEALHAMGEAYTALIEDRERLQLMLQCFAGCDDAEVRASRFAGSGATSSSSSSAPPASRPEVVSALLREGDAAERARARCSSSTTRRPWGDRLIAGCNAGVMLRVFLPSHESNYLLTKGAVMSARTKTLWTFVITSIALFMVTLDNLVVTTAIPVIRDDLTPRSRASSGRSTPTRSPSRCCS